MSKNVRNIYVITIFPELIDNFVSFGVLQKGQDKSLINIKTINLRDLIILSFKISFALFN